tara:strand:+ start:3964 stop:4134 length:171 start_codon:yes stop_codon:yes gene_type:complete
MLSPTRILSLIDLSNELLEQGKMNLSEQEILLTKAGVSKFSDKGFTDSIGIVYNIK